MPFAMGAVVLGLSSERQMPLSGQVELVRARVPMGARWAVVVAMVGFLSVSVSLIRYRNRIVKTNACRRQGQGVHICSPIANGL